MEMRKWTLVLAALVLGACDDSGTDPGTEAMYVVEVREERFSVKVEGAAAIAAMDARMAAGTEGVISGRLVRGNGGFNTPWKWHLDPATVTVPDLAMEVCDGWPSFLEEDLDYWVDTVKQFCPWGAKVVEKK
jgi:hypothetical protein